MHLCIWVLYWSFSTSWILELFDSVVFFGFHIIMLLQWKFSLNSHITKMHKNNTQCKSVLNLTVQLEPVLFSQNYSPHKWFVKHK
jgi:hypothetical protein